MTPSNVRPFERSPQAEELARHWVARIDAGPLSAEERQQLQLWLAQDAGHPRLLDEYALLWATASRARFPATVASPSAAARSPGWRARPWAWGGLGALGAAALASFLWLGLAAPPTDAKLTLAALHSTAVGTPGYVALPDGSRTDLNAASTLRVAYSPGRRRVVLERGEGLFEVAKDKTRPFEVVVGNTVVRAVGTRFLVKRHGDGRVEIAVYEGVVEVIKPAAHAGGAAEVSTSQGIDGPQPIRLGVGQMAVSAAEQTQVVQPPQQALERKLAWQQGRIEFDRTPLIDALEEVNRYSAVPIRLGSTELHAIPVSGSFSTHGGSAVFLRSLEQGFSLKVQRVGEAWVLSRADTP